MTEKTETDNGVTENRYILGDGGCKKYIIYRYLKPINRKIN